MEDTGNIGPAEFARLVGVEPRDLPHDCVAALGAADLHFRYLHSAELDQLVRGIATKIATGSLSRSGEERQADWERGWRESLDRFEASGFDPAALVPGYYRPTMTARLERRFVRPDGPQYELDFLKALRFWLFHRFMDDAPVVYEFGCGSCHNMASLAEAFPSMRIVGLDWAHASLSIAEGLARRFGHRVSGRHFDFFNPDLRLLLEPGSVVFTMGALEQVGSGFGPFLDFLLEQAPALCVNVEPLVELYDERYLLDHLGAWYSRRRGYLSGFLPRLRQLEEAGAVQVITCRHLRFGGTYHDGWSFVAWRPTGGKCS